MVGVAGEVNFLFLAVGEEGVAYQEEVEGNRSGEAVSFLVEEVAEHWLAYWEFLFHLPKDFSQEAPIGLLLS